MRVPLNIRRNVLIWVAALVVAYVRRFLQYHQYSWRSIQSFLLSWFVHYIAILILGGISYALINSKAYLFLSDKSGRDRITIDEAIVYVSIVLLVAAVFIFLVAHWPQPDMPGH